VIHCDYSLLICAAISVVAILLIGISKAGFGGAAGILTTPLLSLIFAAKFVIGFMLPLMILADGFTIYHHRWHWDWKNLRQLIPGTLLGIGFGWLFIGSVSDVGLKRAIGFIVIVFVAFQFIRSRIFAESINFHPRWWHGALAGAAAGFVSTVAHSAGVIIALYLLPQKLDKRVYVSTMVLYFAGLNLTKLIPYFQLHLITAETVKLSLFYIPFIPLGTFIGAWMNRKLSQQAFITLIYIFVVLTALKLVAGSNLFPFLIGR